MKLSMKFLAMLIAALALAVARAARNAKSFNETCENGGDEAGVGIGVGVGVGVVLEFNFYENSCPEAEEIVYSWVETAILQDSRMAASLLRLHFHDCFVNGCDGSVLLDDREGMEGEKTAPPNLNSLRGFEVIDAIKSELESACADTVSCADILALVARDSVVLSGGPSWEVELGRKDGKSASKEAATKGIPSPNSTVPTLISNFQNVGLSPTHLVALSGAHTMGKARCSSFAARLQTNGDNLDFLQSLQQLCSNPDPTTALAQLDLVTPATFDNQYYVNLLSGEGLLPSDQALVAQDEQTRAVVETYAADQSAFFEDFKDAMVKMGGLIGTTEGEIRKNCRAVN